MSSLYGTGRLGKAPSEALHKVTGCTLSSSPKMQSLALRLRPFATRTIRGAQRRSASGPAWGTEVNEPGGRLFGEKILAPGERREVFDWELPYIGSLVLGTVICVIGLNSRPETAPEVWARKEAIEREAKNEAAEE